MMGDLSAMWAEEDRKKNQFYREYYENNQRRCSPTTTYERQIPNEPGALLDALLEFNETPEGQEALKQIKEMMDKIDYTGKLKN